VPSKAERERKSNLIVAAAVAGLILLTVVAVAAVSMSGRSSADAGRKEPATVASAPVAAPPPARKARIATPPAEVATVSAKPEAPAPKSKPKPVAPPPPPPKKKTLPELMARVPSGSHQIIVITGAKIGSKSGTLALYDESGGHWTQVLSVPANFGANGLIDGQKRTTGNLQTPTGIWTIGGFLFGQHAHPPAGTQMKYRPITSNSWWSAVHDSTYNTWVESGSSVSGEHLADARVQYEYAFDSGYNSPPNERVIGRGTAIFIHCAEPPGNSLGKNTHGCVAVDPSVMKKLFTTLDPARNPTCAIGTLQKGSATSIWAY
jgi:L,D-peptidoglycan transpeptidase YkuD (ErfK/YbiS/YcfS/YnhG family)